MEKNKHIPLEERVAMQMESARAVTELLSGGLSHELIVVKMGEILAGINPCTASLRKWERGDARPSRSNGAALAYVYREIYGKPFKCGEEE